jgi:spore maturation protein CgeB
MVTGISDEERNRIGARARDRILSQHTSEHRADQFEEIVSTCSMAAA